jgi:hypothetical protein
MVNETRTGGVERIWVALDYIYPGQVSGFRGRMASNDFDALVQGKLNTPFVLLENVHWIEKVRSDESDCNMLKVTAYGRDGMVRHHNGEVYLRPENIATIATLDDCRDLLLEENRIQTEESFTAAKPVIREHAHD